MAKGRRPSATSSSSNASKAKAIYMTKKEYKDVRVLWSRKSIEMFEKLSPTMSTAQQIQLKRFLKNMFKSIFTQVEKHATIGGRRPKKKSDESKPSAKDIKMRKEKLLEMVNETVKKSLEFNEEKEDKDARGTKRKRTAATKMPSENTIATVKDIQEQIKVHLDKIEDVQSGYTKAAQNLLKYVKGLSVLDDVDVSDALQTLEQVCNDGNGASSSSRQTAASKRGKHMNKVSKALRASRW